MADMTFARSGLGLSRAGGWSPLLQLERASFKSAWRNRIDAHYGNVLQERRAEMPVSAWNNVKSPAVAIARLEGSNPSALTIYALDQNPGRQVAAVWTGLP